MSLITVYDVGPRDGLQNEAAPIATAAKVALIDRLSAAGLPAIEVAAFVSPRWVPQMADAAEVCAAIARRPGTRYAALVPNAQGLERALAAGITEVGVFAAASETFSRRYAPGASGNLATEDLLYLLHGLDLETGIDPDAVLAASTALEPALDHPLPSRYVQARRAART